MTILSELLTSWIEVVHLYRKWLEFNVPKDKVKQTITNWQSVCWQLSSWVSGFRLVIFALQLSMCVKLKTEKKQIITALFYESIGIETKKV